LATIEAVRIPAAERKVSLAGERDGLFLTTALTFVALLIHGYHPYAEDGGIYLPSIERMLHPNLFPAWTEFVTVHARYSLFAAMVAGLVRVSHLDLMVVVFLLYLASIWVTLFSAWKIAKLCHCSREGCTGAVTVLALTLTIPVAGTSLLLMDPYVTARSFSTPCSLLALVGALGMMGGWEVEKRRRWSGFGLVAGSLLLAGIAHPLMGGYALGCVLFLGCLSRREPRWRIASTVAVVFLSFGFAALLSWLAPSQTSSYALAAQTRTYWFVDTWHWYEWLGLIAPLFVLAGLWWRGREGESSAEQLLAQMAIAAGSTALVVATVFAQESARTYMVARMQPLRIYQMVYVLMLVALGAVLGERILKRSVWRWAALCCVVGGGMLLVQRQTFPHSAHLELPWSGPGNGWEQGFEWIREHTPENAVFALDADYIAKPGEDTQNFRAIAERSALPDYSKDGGAAAIAQDLTGEWMDGERVQRHLDRRVAADETAKLRSAGVSWVVLAPDTPTNFACVYWNAVLKVCAVR
jgi:hypothetical protein